MIKGPKNATPTLKGWVSSKGELLKVQKITQAQIDEWNGVSIQKPIADVEVVVEQEEVEIPTPSRKKTSGKSRIARAVTRAKTKLSDN